MKKAKSQSLEKTDKFLAIESEDQKGGFSELSALYDELNSQIQEKELRIAGLMIANRELVFQNQGKEKLADELVIANKELIFQNQEKEKRAAELLIANLELAFQNEEKEKRAAELLIANQELAFQNKEKEKRAAELVIANKELAFQNLEKEKRATELSTAIEALVIAKAQIVDLNVGLEQKIVERTSQLEDANRELESFSYSVSHDLRAPLRAINGFTQVLAEDYAEKFDEEGRIVIQEIIVNSKRMGELIDNLLEFSHIGKRKVSIATIDMQALAENVVKELLQQETNDQISVTINTLPDSKGDRNLIKQVFINLISNALKYSSKESNPQIEIGSLPKSGELIYYVKDNGVGFDMRYYEKLFGVFQRLHSNNEFEGTGVGLAIIHRIITKHGGKAWAESKVNEGACFYFSLPI